MNPRPRIARASRLAAGGLLAVAAAIAAPLTAAAQDPFAPDASEEARIETAVLLQYGWWNKAQQSPAGGSPTPAPPGAPSDGIYILYGPTGAPTPPAVSGPLGALPPRPAPANPRPLGPEAFGAVRYAVPPGAEASLTLKFSPRSSSQPGSVPTVGGVSACPVSSAWDPVQNGRYDSAPVYDCANGAPASVAGDTITFTLPAALAVDGVFDLALVPLGTQPYDLAIQRPDDSSMQLTSVPESETSSEESFDPGTFEDPAASFEADATFDDGTALAADDFGSTTFDTDFESFDSAAGAFTAPVAGRTPAGATRRAEVAVQAGNFPSPFDPDASRTERMMAVALLLGLVAALWWVGGKPVRPPRLLGSLGSGAVAAVETTDARGIGRFSRVRTGERPPRLF